jgi:deaminated glutathione amidase
MTGKVKVAAIQMTSTADVEHNLSRAEALCREAAADGAKLIVLPECFESMSPENIKLALAESLPEGGPILKRMSALARSLNCELILGGFWETSTIAGKVFNTSVHLSAQGDVRAAYRKIHLFDVQLNDGTKLQESATMAAGNEPVVTDTALGKLGLSICYDMRFPELYRKLVDMGAIALTMPAAFTLTTGKDHWHVLLRARAIEAQCYVIAAAQTGHHYGSRMTYGHALICDPWGTVLAECGEGEGYAAAYLDPATVTRIRAQLPSLKHRKL